MRRACEIPADAFLRKPFNLEEVEALLHRFLSFQGKRAPDSGLRIE